MKSGLFTIGRDGRGRALFLKQDGPRFTLTRKGSAGESDATVDLSIEDIRLIAEVAAS